MRERKKYGRQVRNEEEGEKREIGDQVTEINGV